MNTGTVEVLTLADERYAIPLAVAVRSLLDRIEDGRHLNLSIVDGGIGDAVKQKLVDSWSTSAAWRRCRIIWREPDYGLAASLPEWGRVPKLTYARINLDAYLPQGSRVLVLDSDILVRTGVGRLWDTDLDGAVAAACVDPFIPTIASSRGLAQLALPALRPNAPYLNAGVFLADLDLWRQRQIGARAIEVISQNPAALRWYDQDAINAVLAGQWKILDARWQMQPRWASLMRAGADHPAGQAWMFHFSGRVKPWIHSGRSQADREFFEVLDRTAWSGWRPSATAGRTVTRFYEDRLRRIFYPCEVPVLRWLDRISRTRAARRK